MTAPGIARLRPASAAPAYPVSRLEPSARNLDCSLRMVGWGLAHCGITVMRAHGGRVWELDDSPDFGGLLVAVDLAPSARQA